MQGNDQIFDSGDVSGTGTANVSYGPGSSTDVSIIMNPGSTTTNADDLWNYTVTSTQAKYYYLAFTEDTNLTTTPIKFAVPPFIPNTNTSTVFTDSLESVTSADYLAGQSFGTWTVVTNQVSVITYTNIAYQGSNFLALANGMISNNLPTVAGQTYALTFAYRGPSAVGWWRGESNAVDSAEGHNGLLAGGAGYTNGEVGKTFGFNGVNQYVMIPWSPDFVITNQLSIDFWMKADPANTMTFFQGLFTSDFYVVEISQGHSGGMGVNFSLNFGNSGNFWGTADANGGGQPVSAGVWHHIAGTYDGDKMQLYVDGQPSGNPAYYAGPILNISSSSFLSIASEEGRTACGSACTANRFFNGLIDEATIYNRALSASEIKAIFTNGPSGKFNAAEFAVSPAQSLAGATVNLQGAYPATFFGNDTNWQTKTITFTATQNGTPLTITGIAPGMLLDSFSLSETPANLYYQPEQDISALNGQSAAGTWTLEIQDDRAGAGLTNTLDSWQLEFEFANTNLATPPVFLSTPASTNINELTMLTVTNAATNFTSGTLTYTLLNPPAGATINPTTGVITWTPSEAQGPGDYTITTIATDSGPPSSSVTNSFIVSVAEVNTPPIFLYPTNTTVISVIDTFPFDAFASRWTRISRPIR